MDNSTYSEYGITDRRGLQSAKEPFEGPDQHDHYEVFLMIESMLLTTSENILEFPFENNTQSTITKCIGSGGFSSVSMAVSKARWGRNTMAYKRALPSFDCDGKPDTKAVLVGIIDELRVCSRPRMRAHCNISGLKGISFESDAAGPDPVLLPVLMFEPSPLGNLLNFISDGVRMVDGPYWEYCLDVCRGLKALHEDFILHGDVKCENVLVFPTPANSGRPFTAKLTDFGCSMDLTTTEPYTKLRGRTLPYDAPEANEVIPRHALPFSDIYSFGLLVWRVAMDGADLFRRPEYSELDSDDGQRVYKHDQIRQDKKSEDLLNLVLSTIQDPDLQFPSETADAFCEVLSIALHSDPELRSLDRIIETFERNKGNFKKREFGLSRTCGFIIREFIKAERLEMINISSSQYGLCHWKSLPEGAISIFSTFKALHQRESGFNGFNSAKKSTLTQALINLLRALENLLSIQGKDPPTLEEIAPTMQTQQFPDMKIAFGHANRFVENVTRDAFPRARRFFVDTMPFISDLPFIRSYQSAFKEVSEALGKFRESCVAFAFELESSVRGTEWRQNIASSESKGEREASNLKALMATGLFDEPGGLADLDSSEEMKSNGANSILSVDEPSVTRLDFDLLLSLGLPYKIQKQLFADLSDRIANTSASGPFYPQYMMEQAVCYLLGFGVTADHQKYLSTLAECCRLRYGPAKAVLQPVHAALGVPLPQNALNYLDSVAAEEDITALPTSRGYADDGNPHTIPASIEENSIHAAAVSGSGRAVLEFLHRKPGDINLKNSAGDTPLLCACRSGQAGAAKLLLDAGADAGLENSLGESPLHWIVKINAADISTIAILLLTGGAWLDALAKDSRHQSHTVDDRLVAGTALHRAVAHGNGDAVQVLLSLGASPDSEGGPVFFYNGHSRRYDSIQLACILHETHILEILLDAAPFYPINPRDEAETGLLYLAIQCRAKHHRMVRHGLKFYYRMQDTIDFLMQRGSTNIVSGDGLTALHLAVIHGTIDILEYLLTSERHVRDIATLVRGKSPLHCAIIHGDESKFELLIKHGACTLQSSTTWPEKIVKPVLDVAAQTMRGDCYFVKRILEIHPELPQIDKDMALVTAFNTRQFGLAEFLLQRNANINSILDSGTPNIPFRSSLLGRIFSNPRHVIVEVLENFIRLAKKFDQKPDFVVMPDIRMTALHQAAGQMFMHSRSECSRLYTMLLDLFPGKSHLEARDFRGGTPLHMAIYTRNVVSVQVLLDAGAEVNSMMHFEGVPVGPSAKDLLFFQFFAPESYYLIDKGAKREGERALEELVNVFKSPPVSIRAKRSQTLRAQGRANMDHRQRTVSNFIDVLSLLPEKLPRLESIAQKVIGAVKVGSQNELSIDSGARRCEIARTIQWSGLEGLRVLNHDGAAILEKMGLLELYLDQEEKYSLCEAPPVSSQALQE